MPSYWFDVAATSGVQRVAFSIDHDRPLGPQVTQVLEELRQRGVVLQGGRDDELGVYWNGRALDLRALPTALGIAPDRPIELRMREREQMVAASNALPRSIVAATLLGYAAGVLAWAAVSLANLPAHFTSDYARLDQITMLLIGMIVGGVTLGGVALRTRGVVLLGVVLGIALGGVGALGGTSVALLIPAGASVRAFVLARVVSWALAGGGCTLLLTIYLRPLVVRRVVESVVIGGVGGALGGVVFVLPGPSDLWQAVAIALFGAGIAIAVCGPALWHALATVEVVASRGRVGMLTLREWPVHNDAPIELGALRVAAQAGRVALYPPPNGADVDGRAVHAAIFVEHDCRVAVAGDRFRVRLLGGAS